MGSHFRNVVRIEVISDVWTTTVTVVKAAEFYFYFMMKGRERDRVIQLNISLRVHRDEPE